MDSGLAETRKVNPKEIANFLSVITFFYSLKLFKRGVQKELQENDLYEVLQSLKSKELGDRLEEEFQKQKTSRKTVSIMLLIWKCYGLQYFLIGLMQLTMKTAFITIQPYALGKLIAYFASDHSELSRNDAYLYAGILITANFIHCVYVHNYHLILMAFSLKVRTAFCSFLYRKTLKLKPDRVGDISIGKIVTLLTKDVHSFERFFHFANDLWIGVIKTMIISYVIYQKIGLAAAAGIAFCFIILPIQVAMGSWSAKLRISMCKKTDERLQVTQETLSAIKVIKMYTWEFFFNRKVAAARRNEVWSLHKIFYLKFIMLQMGHLNSKIAFYLMIMTYTWLGNHATASIVYFVLSSFHTLSHTMSVLFPLGISQTAELVASMRRVGNVLNASEVEPVDQATELTITPKVVFKEVSVMFKDFEILHNINVHFEMGLNLLTGPVGSGKSFLLKTILQDYQPSKGGVEIQGRISYASQEPWLFPSSIKQNILFGQQYDEKRYKQVLRVCALKYDFEMLLDGDATLVEDHGINLSKGQQSRINLARAVYRDADIYLLDDCLAPLDAHVSDYIFKKCLKIFLKDKLVILVSHSTKYYEDYDNIVVLKEGEIKSSGKHATFSRSNLQSASKEIEEQVAESRTTQELIDENDDKEHEGDKLITENAIERKAYQETNQSGEVPWSIYHKYVRFGGGVYFAICVFIIFIAAQFFLSYADKMVSKWVNIEQELANYTMHNATNTSEYEDVKNRRDWALNMYTSMTLLKTVLSLLRLFALFTLAKTASINLHKFMISHVVGAHMRFFDTNFIGNILNRFSKDLNTIDEHLPFVFHHVFNNLLHFGGVVILIATVNTIFLIPTAGFLILLIIIRQYYLPTGRSLKRLDAATRSPMVGHLNATLEGLTTIRAFKAEQILKDEFDRHQDLYTSAFYLSESSMRSFAFFLDTLCTVFVSSIISFFTFIDSETSAGHVGLAVTQANTLVGNLQHGIREWAEIENCMTSVERALEYTEMKQESDKGVEVVNWPKAGEVKYENVSLSYNNSDDYVLKNITFNANPREKIGIVGRTGAGKSSIISTLFRLYEVEGKITIDGVDTKILSLQFLREHISIIPQDPVLFAGTIRDNIDPTGMYNDEQIWNAIGLANLKYFVPSLDLEVSENGSNFSVGQRQLICMARAVIRNNKIIVLDEATANMDPETDTMILETIHKNFADCTVFTIAHKLHTVLKCDKVLVMDKGQIIEYDDPVNLLENKNGIFYKMVKKSGLIEVKL